MLRVEKFVKDGYGKASSNSLFPFSLSLVPVKAVALTLLLLLTACNLLQMPASQKQPLMPMPFTVTPVKHELAKKLAKLMIPQESLTQMFNTLFAQISMLYASENTYEDPVKAELFKLVAKDIGKRHLTTDRMENFAADYFAKAFSDRELQELYRFYNSALGKKIRKFEAKMTSDIINVMTFTETAAEFPENKDDSKLEIKTYSEEGVVAFLKTLSDNERYRHQLFFKSDLGQKTTKAIQGLSYYMPQRYGKYLEGLDVKTEIQTSLDRILDKE